MSSRYYVSEPGGVVRPASFWEWGDWFGRTVAVPFADGGRVVARDKLPGDVTVSTVFLGIDHSFGGIAGPLIFETMIFGGPHDDYQEQYATAAEAEAGHRAALDLARSVTP